MLIPHFVRPGVWDFGATVREDEGMLFDFQPVAAREPSAAFGWYCFMTLAKLCRRSPPDPMDEGPVGLANAVGDRPTAKALDVGPLHRIRRLEPDQVRAIRAGQSAGLAGKGKAHVVPHTRCAPG